MATPADRLTLECVAAPAGCVPVEEDDDVVPVLLLSVPLLLLLDPVPVLVLVPELVPELVPVPVPELAPELELDDGPVELGGATVGGEVGAGGNTGRGSGEAEEARPMTPNALLPPYVDTSPVSTPS